jgi:spermidine/putrescine transport system substrate-binding protein
VDTAGIGLQTWDIVFKEFAELGAFTMLDDSREIIGTALKYLGYSLNTTDPKELAEAEQLLLVQRKRVLAYAPSSPARDYLISGDAVIAHNYSGDVFMAQQENPAIIDVIPRESGAIWTDNLAIPVKAFNKTAAEMFINFTLDPPKWSILTNYTRYASPNEAALPFIEPVIKK